MKKLNVKIVLLVLAFVFVITPFISNAQTVNQPSTGFGWKNLIVCGEASHPCHFEDLITLVQNLINDLVLLSFPIAGIAFAYAGFLILTSAGDMGKVKKGREIFIKVGIGFAIIIGAFTVVSFIVNTFVSDAGIINIIKTK